MRLAIATSTVVSFLVIAPIAYMTADTQPPYEFDVSQSYVVPSTTPAGRQILVHWKISKVNRVCPGSITRFVVDQRTGARVSYDPAPAASNVESNDEWLDRTFFLPPETVPGMKWYYSDGDYSCNPLQRIYPLRVRTPRLSFEVTK